jgi:PKD repeat protein
MFLTRFNAASGTFIKIDTVGSGYGAGKQELPWQMISDKKNNLYIGGQFTENINFPSGTINAVAGGDMDFFVAKFGYNNCNCIAPLSSFTSSAPVSKTVQFTFTGTSAGIDSLVWNFGDGQKQKITSSFSTPIVHTYPAYGKYNASVTVYNGCGSSIATRSQSLDVRSMGMPEGISVYPNPSKGKIYIEGAEGATVVLFNSIGQRLLTFSVTSGKQHTDISSLPMGHYSLLITDRNGNAGSMQLIKAE